MDAHKTTMSEHPSRLASLARKLKSEKFRNAYMSRRLRSVLAAQIRTFRGHESQIAFGKRIDQPQSRVSDLENEDGGDPSVRTLIKIAQKLRVALIIQFVDYATFLKFTEGLSPETLNPKSFSDEEMDHLIDEVKRVELEEVSKFAARQENQKQQSAPEPPINRNTVDLPQPPRPQIDSKPIGF